MGRLAICNGFLTPCHINYVMSVGGADTFGDGSRDVPRGLEDKYPDGIHAPYIARKILDLGVPHI